MSNYAKHVNSIIPIQFVTLVLFCIEQLIDQKVFAPGIKGKWQALAGMSGLEHFVWRLKVALCT